MAGFLSSLFSELGARRRRLRVTLGDRGQAIVEFLVLSGLSVGSLGLLVGDWMAPAAPWGFAMPIVLLIGHVLIDIRRQASMAAANAAPDQAKDDDGRTIVDRTASNYDWIVLGWSFACALAGAAAFVIAWTAKPAPVQQEEIWTPPESSVPVEISP